MCGIAGFFDHQNKQLPDVLSLMLQSQSHRGPDAEGRLFDHIRHCQIALGHRRLSILDVSEKANQPMSYQQYRIVYNGEVYNFSSIRIELEKQGYTFDTDCDTEVILKAFHHWGMACVDQFRGMFAFCILDKNKQIAYLARDRVGTKPLYYYHDKQTFVFASEIQSLQYHPSVKRDLCEMGMQLYFQYGYIPSPWTIFKGIKKINPGCYLEYDIVNNVCSEKQYWSLSTYYLKPKLTLSEADATTELSQRLSESFSLRMIADVPVGVLLSGGIDSSLVACLLQAQTSQPIDTFTMAFDQQDYDESQYARQIAKHIGTQHHEKVCTWQEAEAVIAHLPKIYGEPFADSSSIPTLLISQFAKQKVSVILSGDGGDELFCGYDSYTLNAHRFNKINSLPFKNGLSKLLNMIPDEKLGLHKLNYDGYNRYQKFKSVLNLTHIENQYTSITQTFTTSDIAQLFLNKKIQLPNPHFNHTEVHSLERMMLVDFNQYLPDDLMVKVDRATMYYSLEGREPLLDHKILEFAAQLPTAYKMKKRILKTILRDHLPHSYIERKKQGFGVPVNRWLRKELLHLIKKYLNPEKLKHQGLFNPHYVQSLCKAFLASKTNDNRIWTLIMFQMWHEEHLNQIF